MSDRGARIIGAYVLLATAVYCLVFAPATRGLWVGGIAAVVASVVLIIERIGSKTISAREKYGQD